MNYLIISLLILSSSVFAQVGRIDRFFFAKGEDLLFFDGDKISTITRGYTQLCFPLVLKNTDLYQITVKPVLSFQLIARGVTKVFNNHYLIRDKLYTIIDGKGVYVSEGVTDVFDGCPDPHMAWMYSRTFERI